jgi:hypothetical protein
MSLPARDLSAPTHGPGIVRWLLMWAFKACQSSKRPAAYRATCLSHEEQNTTHPDYQTSTSAATAQLNGP